ncbi:MAG: hypothetical protein GQ583_02525 [Methyloprofundus sp.]|nr:hypothetical protein [Methyloprofundus sp.]
MISTKNRNKGLGMTQLDLLSPKEHARNKTSNESMLCVAAALAALCG